MRTNGYFAFNSVVFSMLACITIVSIASAADPDIAGNYYRKLPTGVTEVLTIRQSSPKQSGEIKGNLNTDACTHELTGTLISPTLYEITVKRTQKSDPKRTCKQFGTLKQLSADKIHTHITSTDGKDDLATDWSEECDWAKSLKP